jgi:zinc protease
LDNLGRGALISRHSSFSGRWFFRAGTFFFLLVSVAALGAVRLPTVKLRTLELPNGLRAVMVERHEAPVVTVEVWYHVGAKDEKPGKTGFAHLFEHLMFDGTKTLGEHFSDYIVKAGGIDNAYTTDDATVFWETMPSSNLPVALWLEADRMRNLDITQATLNNEREVVNEERRQRFENPPYGTVMETLYARAFTVHPYQHLPIGSAKDLTSATLQDVQEFYDTYYVPDDATVVIAGDFSTDQAEALIRKYFGPIPRGTRSISPAIPVEPAQKGERVVRLHQDVALPAFVEAYHIPADGTADSYPLELVSKILSAGESALIYRKLVYEKQLALQADSSANFSEDPNLFFVFAVMNTGHSAAEGEAAVASVLNRLKDAPPSERELQRAKNQVLFELAQDRESSKSLAEQLGYDTVILKNPYLINTEASKFLRVTPEEVQAVVKRYFVPDNMTLLEIYPKQTQQEASSSRGGAR